MVRKCACVLFLFVLSVPYSARCEEIIAISVGAGSYHPETLPTNARKYVSLAFAGADPGFVRDENTVPVESECYEAETISEHGGVTNHDGETETLVSFFHGIFCCAKALGKDPACLGSVWYGIGDRAQCQADFKTEDLSGYNFLRTPGGDIVFLLHDGSAVRFHVAPTRQSYDFTVVGLSAGGTTHPALLHWEAVAFLQMRSSYFPRRHERAWMEYTAYRREVSGEAW